jgi:hypothetical protein
MLRWITAEFWDHLWWVETGAVILVFPFVAGAFWWWVPKLQMRSVKTGHPKERADIEDNFRRTIGQALGGIAVLIGAWAAYYGTQQTLRGNHDQLIRQQVAKGFEQLGQKGDDKDDKMIVRLGGIYALEVVMNDPTSDRYRVPILEALRAFVRDRIKTYEGHDHPATGIQAVLTLIGRRAATEGEIDWAEVRIPGARLRGNLSGADLSGADLSEANLSEANLSGANLTDAKITQAQLNQACGDKVRNPPAGRTFKPRPCPLALTRP